MLRWKITLYTVVLLSVTAISTSSETVASTIHSNKNPIGNDVSSTVVTLPLLTHHGLKRRRMNEMGLSEDEMESYLDSHHPSPSYRSHRRTSLEVGGLYQGYGTHYVDLWVGTPPQRQTVIVDTGSGVTAFPCSECSNCGKGYHASPYFKELESKSFVKQSCNACSDRASCTHPNQSDEFCKIGVSYQEGSSWSAYEAEDKTYLGGPHGKAVGEKTFDAGDGNHLGSGIVDKDPMDAASFSFPMTFGCQTKITGLFKTQLADGIMGMCNQKGAFFRQMYDANIIAHKSFSLCFSREAESESSGTIAGAVTMGGTDTELHRTPMVYADAHVSGGIMHGLAIRRVYFMKAGQYEVNQVTKENTEALDVSVQVLNRGKVILDSGTTDTYFTREMASAFNKVFKDMVGVAYNTRGMYLSDKEVDTLPSLVVQLNGKDDGIFDQSNPDATPGLAGLLDPDHPNDVLVVVPPNRYFEYDTEEKKYRPRIYPTEASGTVLGANFMAGHDVLFDTDEHKRIGFAASDCSYPSLFTDHPKSDDEDEDDHPTREDFTTGKVIPPNHGDDHDNSDAECEDSFTCRYKLWWVLGGGLVVFALRWKYVNYSQNLMEFRRTQTDILNDLYLDEELEQEILDGTNNEGGDGDDGSGDQKEIQMREIT